MCDSFRGSSDVWYSHCLNRARVDVGLSVLCTVSVLSNKLKSVL